MEHIQITVDTPSLFEKVEPEKQARLTDPVTSHIAAEKLSPLRVGSMRRNLMRVFERTTATAEEAATAAGYGPGSGAWKRVSDLLRDGLIEATGLYRPSSSGRDQRVLRITAKGRDAL